MRIFKTQMNNLKKDIIDDLNTYVDSRNDIINIVLITQEGKALYNNANLELKDDIQFEDYDWYQKAKQEEKFTVSNSHIQRLF